MEKEIVEGQIGDVASYDVEFKDGKLVAKLAGKVANPSGLAVEGDLSASIGIGAALDALVRASHGNPIVAGLAGLLKAALGA